MSFFSSLFIPSFTILVLATSLPLKGETPASAQEATLAELIEKAKTENKGIFVLVYGASDWDAKSEEFLAKQWNSSELQQFMSAHLVYTIPFYQNPTEEQRKTWEEIKNKLGSSSYPSLSFLDAQNTVVWTLLSPDLLTSPAQILAKMTEKMKAYVQQQEYVKSADSAQGVDKATLLGKACELDIAYPSDALKKIAEADPEDKSNYTKRLTLNSWSVTEKFADMSLEEAISQANIYLDNPIYQNQHRQEIGIALLGKMRRDAVPLQQIITLAKKIETIDKNSPYAGAAKTIVNRAKETKK